MRETAGLTQQELAARVGWAVGTISDLENHGRGVVAKVNPRALSNGVPVVVYDQILTEATRRYPANYEMQEYIVNEQIAAYRKLHP